MNKNKLQKELKKLMILCEALKIKTVKEYLIISKQYDKH